MAPHSTPAKLAEALAQLSQLGLNIFASCAISSLPEELRTELAKAVPLEGFSSFGLFAHGGRTLWENIEQPALEENHPVDNHSLRCTRRFLEAVAPGAESL